MNIKLLTKNSKFFNLYNNIYIEKALPEGLLDIYRHYL
jgi:hypothetical protein